MSVLFVELSGPVGMGQRLDPEDMRRVVGRALVGVIAKVEVLGGTVTSVSGAGLAALFGAPEAHEDDPERALRAAFGAVSDAEDGAEGLSVRAGIETGQAVVGPIGGASTPHYGAVGEVVGVAAGLESVAKAGSVLVGPVTRRATEGLFEWGPTEEVSISPGAKPLVGSYLERPKPRPLGQAGRRGLARGAPLIGRRTELALLHDVLREVTAGKGGVVLVAGEPGLGKSRLVQECRQLFLAWAGASSGRLPLWLEGRAASYASSSPYGMYQQLLAAWLGVVPEEGPDAVRAALEGAMKAVLPGPRRDVQTALLYRMMGLEGATLVRELSSFTPGEVQEATFQALQAVVSRLARYGPTVLVLEDLHWADATSLSVTEGLCSLTKEAPLLLLLTRRPEPDPGVSAFEAALAADQALRLSRFELSPLDEGAERDLAGWLLGEGTPEDVLDTVSRGVEGNPLFLEERFSSLLETGALERDGKGWHLDHSLTEEVPEALERLVRSRVDRLDQGSHDAIVAASVLGPEFGLHALRTVTDLNGDLAPALSRLCTGGLLTELRKFPEPAYRFRHALIQEATYRGLVSSERRRLHGRAAWGLEEASSAQLEEVAAVLGHHFAMAGEVERAVHYLEMAGDHAAYAFANDEAIASYRYALDLFGRDSADRDAARPGRDPRVKAEAGVRCKLGEVLKLTGRYGEARDALQEGLQSVDILDDLEAARLYIRLGEVEHDCHAYDRALKSLEAGSALLPGSPEGLGPLALDLWVTSRLQRAFVHYWRDEADQMAAVLESLHSLFEANGGPRRRQSRYYNAVQCWQCTQRRHRIDEEILVNARRALAAAEGVCPQEEIGWRIFDLGFCLLWYGDLDGGEEKLTRALRYSERMGSASLRALSLSYLNMAALRRNDPAGVAVLAPQAMQAAYAASRPQYAATAKASLAWVAWKTGRAAEVEALAEEALASWPARSWQPFHWVCLWPLVAVRLAAGQVADAVETARQLLPAP
ncbi:MAG TPA: AAA family ATPase, partial [Acidimicrobiales bacterium]|nr:AAA family ATPase [Acidimicrobiales bacterium]